MPSRPPAPRAYSYVRFSTPEQGKGDSLRRQVEGARAYAATQGLTLDESLRDLGKSAYSGAHRLQGALGGFLKAVQAGQVPRGSVLIVESLDRLSREQVLDALEQFRAILKAGIEIATLSDGQRYSEESVRRDFTQLLVSLLVMARAHEESARKADRVAAAWGAKRRRAVSDGEAMTARCVAWCSMTGKGSARRYELIPERAALVRQVFEWAAGGLGRRSIVKRLNAAGTPTWGRGAGWQDSYVSKILDNRAVLGFGQPHQWTNEGRVPIGPEVEGYYPPVVSPELFHAARAARRSRQGKGGPMGGTVSNLFSGLARCCSCGATMVHVDKGKPPKGGRYLWCDSVRRGLPCTNPKPRVRYLEVEKLLLWGISDMDWVTLADDNHAMEDTEATLARLAVDQGVKEAQIERLLAAFEDARPIPQVADRIRRLGAEVADLQDQAAALKREAGQRVPAVVDFQAAFWNLMIEMRDAEGEALRDVRARIAQEIRRVVGRLEFQGERVRVLSPGGEVVHSFIPTGMPMPGLRERTFEEERELVRAG